MSLIVNESQIVKFLEELKKNFEVNDVRNSVLPFKQYFFPPEETTLKMGKKGNAVVPAFSQKIILFGLTAKDLEALTYLEQIFKDDYYFKRRRDATVVFGLLSEGDTTIVTGGDIIFQKLTGNGCQVLLNSKKGKSFAARHKKFFHENSDEDLLVFHHHHSEPTWQEKMHKLLLDPRVLAEAVEWSKDLKIWDELGQKCVTCGNCTYTCPLCHCFSIKDRIDIDGNASRSRCWTACTLPEFSKTAGGHDFRPGFKMRYYNWFYHKFVRAYFEYGKSQCVGCSGCKTSCPVGIDIYEVLTFILEEYRSSDKKKVGIQNGNSEVNCVTCEI